jgi:hypothetical protein
VTGFRAAAPAGAHALLVTLFTSLPLAFVAARLFENGLGRLVIWIAYPWLGMVLLLLVVLGALEVVRALAHLRLRSEQGSAALDAGRRALLARMLAGAASLLAGGMGIVALRSGSRACWRARCGCGSSGYRASCRG